MEPPSQWDNAELFPGVGHLAYKIQVQLMDATGEKSSGTFVIQLPWDHLFQKSDALLYFYWIQSFAS